MKIVQINATCGNGSTGKICLSISEELTGRGVENYILFSEGDSDYALGVKFCSQKDLLRGALASRVMGNYGFNNRKVTLALIGKLEALEPDVIHFHNLHNHACDLETLFSWAKRQNIKYVWTFHDCWPFTGYCTHYEMQGCEKWKTGCGHCALRKEYSWFLDRSAALYKRKKELFSGLDLTVVTPSFWMADQARRSFFAGSNVQVIHNGIDLRVFKPMPSDFREQHQLQDKRIVLGVAFGWNAKKGLDVFVELARKLPEDYRIVLVGTNDSIDAALPENIISIHRTHDQTELAKIYTAADVFVNPTREEVLGLTNIEALACATPVITFASGGSTECINETCGFPVPKNDVEALAEKTALICEQNPFAPEACMARAKAFEDKNMIKAYIDLYESL